jgi:Ferric reductase like transmembrane component
LVCFVSIAALVYTDIYKIVKMIGKSARGTLLLLCIILQWSFALAFPEAPISANSTTGSPTSNSTTSSNGGNSTAIDKKAAASASNKAVRARNKREDDENWAVVRAFLYFWLALLVLFVLSLLSLVFRRYIRTVSSLSPGNTQAYFAPVNRHWGLFKKHFVFAPLFHKRHHRPFMLTRTIDNGCLPSRPQTFILVSYFLILVFATFYGINYEEHKNDVITAIEKRSGILALANMVPLFILAARNNPLIWWTGISFDTYNLFHRWLGRFIALEVVAHVTAYLYKKVQADGWVGFKKRLETSWFVRSGTIVRNFLKVALSY